MNNDRSAAITAGNFEEKDFLPLKLHSSTQTRLHVVASYEVTKMKPGLVRHQLHCEYHV